MTFWKNLSDWLLSFFKGENTNPPETQDWVIPDSNHILRYIKPSAIHDGAINGSEFLKRPKDEGTSVNWIEYFQGTLEKQIEEIRKKARLEYKKTGLLARLSVGQACSYVLEKSNSTFNLSVVKDPLPEDEEKGFEEDKSHALIKGTPTLGDLQGEYVGDLIEKCIIDTFPAIPDKK